MSDLGFKEQSQAFKEVGMFFSEEKNQKTFASGAHGKIQAMASIVGAAEK
jgi:hypothetical protein